MMVSKVQAGRTAWQNLHSNSRQASSQLKLGQKLAPGRHRGSCLIRLQPCGLSNMLSPQHPSMLDHSPPSIPSCKHRPNCIPSRYRQSHSSPSLRCCSDPSCSLNPSCRFSPRCSPKRTLECCYPSLSCSHKVSPRCSYQLSPCFRLNPTFSPKSGPLPSPHGLHHCHMVNNSTWLPRFSGQSVSLRGCPPLPLAHSLQQQQQLCFNQCHSPNQLPHRSLARRPFKSPLPPSQPCPHCLPSLPFSPHCQGQLPSHSLPFSCQEALWLSAPKGCRPHMLLTVTVSRRFLKMTSGQAKMMAAHQQRLQVTHIPTQSNDAVPCLS